MKKTFYALFAAVMLMIAYSCSDYNIGQSISETQVTIIADSSFTVTGVTVENKIFPARTITQLLGIIIAENYGELRTDVVTQFMPTALVDTVGMTADDIDSCKFILDIPLGYYTGDSIVPMQATIYRLNKSLPSEIYSDFDPEGYYDPADIIGSKTYTASALMLPDSVVEDLDDNYCREFLVDAPRSLAQEIFNKFIEDPELFQSPTAFETYFPGVYIQNTFGSGRVVNIYNTEFRVYYHRHVTDDDGNDSIVSDLEMSYLGATSEIISNNNISLTVDENVLDMIDNGDLIVQSPCGYEVEIEFPIQEIIDMFQSGENDVHVINDLTFEIPAYALSNDYGIKPPDYLLMVKTSEKDDFFATNHVTDDESSFYASYDEDEQCYSFSSMRDFVLDIIDNKGGIAEESDKHFTLTPIDLISESSASSSSSSYYYYYYYYYYGYDTSSTTITGMRPALNKPCIGRLDLENAKIKLEYSTQTMSVF